MKRYLQQIHPYLWIAVIGLMVWGITLSFDFVWDDFPMIAQNASLHQWGTLVSGWSYDFWGLHDTPQPSGYWRPLVTVYHVILSHLSKSAWIFHFFNVFLHISTAILFYVFLQNLKILKWIWIPVLFFLCHPLVAETVSFNSASPDLLSAFFGWAAAVLWTGEKKYQRANQIKALILLTLSFLSKESGVFFGFFLMGLDFLILKTQNKKRISHAIIIVSLICIYAALHKYVVHGFGIRNLWGGDWNHHLATVCKLFIYQIFLLAVPIGSSPVRSFSVITFASPWAWAGLILFLVLIGLFFYFKKQKSIFAFVIFFYLVFWFPVSNILPAEGLIVDRYMYVLCMAFGLAIGLFFNSFDKFPKLLGLILIAYAVWALNHALIWKNSETLWKHAIEVSPTSTVAWNEWGNVLSSKEKYQDAYDAYTRAVGLQPKYRDASYNRAFALFSMNDPLTKDTIDQHLKNFSDDAQAFDLMGSVHEKESNYSLAVEFSKKAVETSPNNWKYRYNLSEIYYRTNQFDKAIDELKMALRLTNERFEVKKNLAAAYCMNGQYKECLNTYQEFIIQFPDHAQEVTSQMDKANQLLELTQGK